MQAKTRLQVVGVPLKLIGKLKERTKVNGNASRPFRIWNEHEHRDCKSRYYIYPENARWGALKECKFASTGNAFQVYDARSGKVVCEYRRGVSSIIFLKD